MTEVFITATVFFGLYSILKMFTDFLLKRKIIKTGHIGKADILEITLVAESETAIQRLSGDWLRFLPDLAYLLTISFSSATHMRWRQAFTPWFHLDSASSLLRQVSLLLYCKP